MPVIRLLGSVDAIVDGATVELGGRRQRRLLLRLVLGERRIVSEQELVDAIWDESDSLPSNPNNTIQQYVSRLRAILGPESILTSASGYALGPSTTTDIEAFEQRYKTARVLHSRGDVHGAHDNVTEAIESWRGPAFGDLGDLPMATFEARRLEELRVSALELEAQTRLESGDLVGAIAASEGLAAEHPLREAPVRTLALARHQAGQPADAVRALAEFRRRLADETGLEPTLELTKVERQLLENDDTSTQPAIRRLRGYELGEMIAQGAFGAVYRAIQPSVGREVAIKVVRAELANNPQFIRRFEVEAQVVARLEHPHIVPLHDYWREPGGAYLVMRYLRGGSAEQRLVTDGPMSLAAMARLVDEIGGALAMAHDAGIVHRDVKPANIIFDENDNAYLADFGIAVTDGGTAELDLRSAGSPLYVSPEQIRHGEAVFASDLYAFGVVIYELLTGSTPFPNVSTIPELLERKLNVRLPLASMTRPDIPATVDAIIQRATEPRPADRFVGMGELILAFRAAMAGHLSGAATTGSTGSANSPAADTGVASSQRPRAQAARTVVTLEWQGTNPYKGLAAFQEADASDFFGRRTLIERLRAHLVDSRFLAVVGPSGSGKSSVVRAGLVPLLRDSGAFVAQMVPGQHPLHELETALLRVAVDPLPTLREQLTADTHGFARVVERCLPEERDELVLVIDQFEELYTMAGDDERREFLVAVAAAIAAPHSRLRVVVTLRADFYDRPLASPDISALFDDNTIAVTPLSPDELELAIVGPAERVGASVEPALVAAVVNDVRHAPGALPLVQFALTETFEHRAGSLMTLDAYRGLGGVMGALAKRADEVYAEATEEERGDLQRLFTRLITPGEGTEDTRRRIKIADLPAVRPSVIEACDRARLVSFDHDQTTREPTVEVAHEALIREWARLRSWLDDDRDGLRMLRHLDAAAGEWELAGRPPADLYRGGRLEAVEEWIPNHQADLNPRERDFIDASITQRRATLEAEARTTRRLRRLLAGVAIVAAIALVASGLAFQQRARADTNAAEAEAQAIRATANESLAEQRAEEAEKAAFDAETGRLTASVETLVETNPRAALLVATAASQREQSPETLGALQAALIGAGPLVSHLRWGVEYVDVEWLPDGRIIGIRLDGVDLIDSETGVVIDSVVVEVPIGLDTRYAAETAAVDENGTTLVVATTTPSVLSFDLSDDGLDLVAEVATEHSVYAVAVSDDRRFVVADTENQITGFDNTGRRLFRVDVDDAESFGLQIESYLGPHVLDYSYGIPVRSAVSADAEVVTVVSGMVLHRLDWGGRIVAGPTPMGSATEILASGSHIIGDGGTFLDVVGVNATTRIDLNEPWPAETVANNFEGIGLFGTLVVDAARRDGELVAVLDDGAIVRYDATSGRQLEVQASQLGEGRAIAGSPRSDVVVVAHANGLALLRLDGGNPLTTSVPRHAESAVTSISTDGSIVVLGPLGKGGPSSAWEISGGALEEIELGVSGALYWAATLPDTELVEVWGFADIPSPANPTPAEALTLLRATDRAVVATLADPPGSNAGDLSVVRGLYVLGANSPARGHIFDLNTETFVGELATGGSSNVVSSVRFDPVRDRLLIATPDGVALLYDVDTWQPIEHPVVAEADIVAAHWSLDGTLIVTASTTGEITIRDGETFEPIRTMVGNANASNAVFNGSLLLSADNRLLLSNHDGPARLWDVASGRQIGSAIDSFPGTLGGLNRGDELRLVTAGADNALVWNLRVDEWATIACRTAGSELTEAEWAQWGPRDEQPRTLCGASA